MSDDVRPFRGGQSDPFRGDVDRASAMRAWLVQAETDPSRRVRAASVMLQGIVGAHRRQREQLLDQIWKELVSCEVAQELAERLDEWADENPGEQADGLAARAMQRAAVPVKVVQGAWQRELDRRGGGDLDWSWLVGCAEPEFLVALAGRANSIGYEGGRALLARLFEFDRTAALRLLKHLGLNEAGIGVDALVKIVGPEAVLRLSPPSEEAERWAWHRIKIGMVGRRGFAEAERCLSQNSPVERRVELATWMEAEGDIVGALRCLADDRHPMALRLLEASGEHQRLSDLLWPDWQQLEAGDRLRLARSLLALGRVDRVRTLLDEEEPGQAIGLRLEVLIHEGDSEALAAMVNARGLDALPRDGALRWDLFDALAEHDGELAARLVIDVLDAAPRSKSLRRLVDLVDDGEQARVLDALLLKKPSLALFQRRMEMAVGADRLRLMQQRAQWRSEADLAAQDLRELSQLPQGQSLALHTARRLLQRFDGASELLRLFIDLSAAADRLAEVVEPTLLCAARLGVEEAHDLLGESGLALLDHGCPELAARMGQQLRGEDLRSHPALMLMARLQVLDGEVQEPCRRLLEAAMREPIRPEQVELARLAVGLGGLDLDQRRGAAQRWPSDGAVVCGYLLAALEAGEAVDATMLDGVEVVSLDCLVSVVEAGLTGDLSGLVCKLPKSVDPSTLRQLAIRRGRRDLLDGLVAAGFEPGGGLLQWIREAHEAGHLNEALALCTEPIDLLGGDVVAQMLRILAAGGDDPRGEAIALRALQLGQWDEHLVGVTQGVDPSSPLFYAVLQRDPNNIELIARARRAEPQIAHELLAGLDTPVAAAARLGLVGERPDIDEIDVVFEAAVAQLGRVPALLRWWTELTEGLDKKLLEEAIAANPGRWSARRLLSLARRQVGSDRRAARSLLERAYGLCPEDPDVRRALADLWRGESPQRAKALLEPLLAVNEPEVRDLRRAARVEMALGAMDQAAELFETSGMPRRAGPMADAVQVFMLTDRLPLAASWCESLIRQHGGQMTEAELGAVYADLGRVRAGLDQPVAAVACFERAVELGADDGSVWAGLGRCLLRLKSRRHDAHRALERAVAASPHEQRVELLTLLSDDGADPWRVADLLDAHRSDVASHFELTRRLAEACRQTARFDEAFGAGMRAIELAAADDKVAMLVWVGHLAFEHLTDLQRALASWNSALDIDPAAPGAMDGIEAACVQSEAWDLLVVNLHRQIERFGDGQASQRYAAWTRVARLAAEELGRAELEVVALSELIAIEDLSETRIRLASALSRLERYAEVVPLLQPMWQANGLGPTGARLLLEAHAALGVAWRALAIDDVLSMRGVGIAEAERTAAWREAARVDAPLTAAEQNMILPPILRGEVGEAMSAAWHLLHQAIARDPLRPNGLLGRRHKRVSEEDERLAVKVFYRVARLFRAHELSLYLVPRGADDLRVFPSKPLSLVAGAHAPFLREDQQAALRFRMGRVVGLVRPEIALLASIGLQGLTDLCAAVGLRHDRPDPSMVGHWRELIGGGLEIRLRPHLERIVREPVDRLVGAAERLSLSAGLVACGDLSLAMEEARRLEPLHARLSDKDVEQLFCRLWTSEGRFVGRIA